MIVYGVWRMLVCRALAFRFRGFRVYGSWSQFMGYELLVTVSGFRGQMFRIQGTGFMFDSLGVDVFMAIGSGLWVQSQPA